MNLLYSGLSVTEVSRLLDISRPTIYKWQHKQDLRNWHSANAIL
ncbi:MAG TPA: hypothetical protein DCE56_24035 [Cyanobacteria bacterium UBA8553]|nr:hypothetical protein [Cyanobacteria bacterium UBA8553]HAJ63951.1 hypothetical protein [Cyanobacteria bacterium UBA8543]